GRRHPAVCIPARRAASRLARGPGARHEAGLPHAREVPGADARGRSRDGVLHLGRRRRLRDGPGDRAPDAAASGWEPDREDPELGPPRESAGVARASRLRDLARGAALGHRPRRVQRRVPQPRRQRRRGAPGERRGDHGVRVPDRAHAPAPGPRPRRVRRAPRRAARPAARPRRLARALRRRPQGGRPERAARRRVRAGRGGDARELQVPGGARDVGAPQDHGGRPPAAQRRERQRLRPPRARRRHGGGAGRGAGDRRASGEGPSRDARAPAALRAIVRGLLRRAGVQLRAAAVVQRLRPAARGAPLLERRAPAVRASRHAGDRDRRAERARREPAAHRGAALRRGAGARRRRGRRGARRRGDHAPAVGARFLRDAGGGGSVLGRSDAVVADDRVRHRAHPRRGRGRRDHPRTQGHARHRGAAQAGHVGQRLALRRHLDRRHHRPGRRDRRRPGGDLHRAERAPTDRGLRRRLRERAVRRAEARDALAARRCRHHGALCRGRRRAASAPPGGARGLRRHLHQPPAETRASGVGDRARRPVRRRRGHGEQAGGHRPRRPVLLRRARCAGARGPGVQGGRRGRRRARRDRRSGVRRPGARRPQRPRPAAAPDAEGRGARRGGEPLVRDRRRREGSRHERRVGARAGGRGLLPRTTGPRPAPDDRARARRRPTRADHTHPHAVDGGRSHPAPRRDPAARHGRRFAPLDPPSLAADHRRGDRNRAAAVARGHLRGALLRRHASHPGDRRARGPGREPSRGDRGDLPAPAHPGRRRRGPRNATRRRTRAGARRSAGFRARRRPARRLGAAGRAARRLRGGDVRRLHARVHRADPAGAARTADGGTARGV
ncbi:MAG: hypothetical protein AVDCRST_MAG11-479, partial [uncultured Gemmatimonadaceae bacterium]